MKLAEELTLRVYEIYRALQGETSRVGLPCVIVRLAGCDLRCAWCDTLEAANVGAGKEMTVADIARAVEPLGTRLICLTGGEPLLQKNTPALAAYFAGAGYTVQVETNGAKPIAPLREPIIRIMDIKCPASGMSRQCDFNNLADLRPTDEVKFVIATRDDYEYARQVIENYNLRAGVLMSPLTGPQSEIAPALLAEWMLYDDLDARLQLQLHKIIWDKGEPKK
ncbi:7-carboxy-7-deazaguanine synthase [Planctomycetales bacterium]|nr:7-carboxy-7-deazaguanine synthase [Planctomycetales bacterium]GHS99561.1 7-carboxy-7-deazaguanine synthase [Planctomycetales bacterium]GHT07637.1 7-carboxy-7-deazaguanine synthase [Planctomycetales bacterium]